MLDLEVFVQKPKQWKDNDLRMMLDSQLKYQDYRETSCGGNAMTVYSAFIKIFHMKA